MVWAIPAGLLIGLALGGLGGGGSILTVPALVYLVGMPVHSATTASLVVVGTSALTGLASHHRAGHVRIGPGVIFGVLGVVGAVVGTRLSAHIAGPVLLLGFAALLLVAAVAMLRKGRAPRSAALDPTPEDGAVVAGSTHRPPVADATPESALPSGPASRMPWARVVLAASVVGLLTGFFGVGGGFAVVPALVLTLGFAMPEAVGTSLLVIVINAVSSFTTRAVSGGTRGIDWAVVAVFAAAAAIGALVGARGARRISPRVLTRSFAMLLIAVATYLAVNNALALAAR